MTSGRRDGLRDRWRPVVFADREINEGSRVLLLLLADTMGPSGYVSVPRERLAAELNVSPREVTRRVNTAVKAGLLSKRGGGYNGRTAEYEALMKVAVTRPPSPA